MNKTTNRENIIAAIVSVILALVQGFASPLHPWIHGELNVDSGVFQTVALMMEHGYMPYRDSFDHKGPFLYILNWLGRRIGGYCGVWYIELIAIAVTIFFMYKTARLVSSVLSSSVATLMGLALVNNYFEGGNFSEEYAMPLIAIGTFIFADYYLNSTISKVRLLVSGACLGLVLMLRPNMIAIWIVFCLAIAVSLMAAGKWQDLGEFILWFLLGIGIAVFPMFFWLFLRNDLREFIDAYLLFNMKYTKATWADRWDLFLFFLGSSTCVITSVCAVVMCFIKKNRGFNITYAIYLAVAFALVSMSGSRYPHYGLVLIPAVSHPVACALGMLEDNKNKVPKAVSIGLKWLAWIGIVLFIFVPSWKTMVLDIPKVYQQRNDNHLSQQVNNIYEFIHYTSDETQTLSVFGNWDTIYVLTERPHATRYSFQFPIGDVDHEIIDDYFSQLQDELPDMIVVKCRMWHEEMGQFLAENNYQMIYAENSEDPFSGAALWRLQ